MLEDGWRPPEELIVNPQQTVDNFRGIALNNTFKWYYKPKEGRPIPAITIQRIYLGEAKKRFQGRDKDTDWTLSMWEKTLDTLEQDPLEATWLDWVQKFQIVHRLETKGWKRAELVRVDLAFHAADPDKSIFKLLGGVGVDEDAIVKARKTPPQNTRAAARGAALTFIDQVYDKNKHPLPDVNWSAITFRGKALHIPDSRQVYQEELADFKKQVAAA